MHLGSALQGPCEWSNRALSNRHIIGAVEVKQTQSILGAVVHIGIAANARHRKEIDLWSHHRARNC